MEQEGINHDGLDESKNPVAEIAISVRNGHKSYGKGNVVLQSFNMTVYGGTIYSLLGASGCGKTTVLSAIIGIRPLTGGVVKVFGHVPGTAESGIPGSAVGYMPQGITLYSKLTLKETFEYFGRIYGMSDGAITKKVESLCSLLDLPDFSMRICNLSGGQQRRVSLGVCLLHDPRLLILDEPTVGVDPLLRERIWEYLHDIVTTNKSTVVITTHYIEEAKDSHTIGLMRNGRLLTEKSPKQLLEEYQTPLLEEIVIRLCKADTSSLLTCDPNQLEASTSSSVDNKIEGDVECVLNEVSFYSRIVSNGIQRDARKDSSQVKGLAFRKTLKSFDSEDFPSSANDKDQTCSKGDGTNGSSDFKGKLNERFRKTKALTIRNALNLFRNPILLYSVFFLPSFNIILVHFTVGVPPKNLQFGIVDPETNYNISECKQLEHAGKDNKCFQNLSCGYVNCLSSSIITPVSMPSVTDAIENVQRGSIWGFLVFPQNYSQHLQDRLIAGNFPDNSSLIDSSVSLRLDMSEYISGQALTKEIYESFRKFSMKAVEDCDQDPRKIDIPLNYRKPVYGSFDESSNIGVSSAVLLLITFFIPTLTTCLSTITDRKDGTLDRTVVAGASRLDFLLAVTLTEGATIIVQSIISYLVGTLVFQWEIKGSHVAFVILLFLTGTVGMSSSFLLAQFCNEEIEALIIAVGFFVFHLPITGLTWPLEGSPPAQRVFTKFFPLNWAIDASRSIIIRGWPLFHPKVWPSFVVLSVAILLPGIFAIKFWRR